MSSNGDVRYVFAAEQGNRLSTLGSPCQKYIFPQRAVQLEAIAVAGYQRALDHLEFPFVRILHADANPVADLETLGVRQR